MSMGAVNEVYNAINTHAIVSFYSCEGAKHAFFPSPTTSMRDFSVRDSSQSIPCCKSSDLYSNQASGRAGLAFDFLPKSTLRRHDNLVSKSRCTEERHFKAPAGTNKITIGIAGAFPRNVWGLYRNFLEDRAAR